MLGQFSCQHESGDTNMKFVLNLALAMVVSGVRFSMSNLSANELKTMGTLS